MTDDMVAAGFAASLDRPGGNITGISLMSPDLDGKRQDILIEAIPGAQRVAVLVDANVRGSEFLRSAEVSVGTAPDCAVAAMIRTRAEQIDAARRPGPAHFRGS